VGIPKNIPGFIGSQFEKEIENLSQVFNSPKKPVVSIISGVKKDKLDYIKGFKKFSDIILIGGRLPEFMEEGDEDPSLLIGRLNPDKEDLTIHSIEKFEEQIATAGTIIFAGPPSLYEDPGHKLATERVITAIANNIGALRIAGGGDTGKAIKHFHAEESFDWISSGGGASLEFLANGTLPGLQALLN
jgi:phosphoglycerate kinase